MGKLLSAAALALLFAVTPAWADEPPDSATWSRSETPADLPKPALTDLDGAPAGLGDGPVLLHFWATWCGPCVEELPQLERLAAALAPRGVRVVVVSEDRGGADDVRPFLSRQIPLPHLVLRLDPGRRMAALLKLRTLPTTVVVGGDGRERARLVGAGAWEGADRQHLDDELSR